MKILVTGKAGQVARCLADRESDYPAFELIFAARKGAHVALDLTDEASMRTAVQTVQPDVIVNAAAFTAVDVAEDEPQLALQVNGVAPGILAEEANRIGAKFIQISTDYVFDGKLDRPYLPSDPVNPLGVYGRTKRQGEEAVMAAMPDYVIARTAWVYSPYGKNFKKTMLKLAESRDEISVVDDQIGNPTSAYEIADALLTIIDKWAAGGRDHLGEIIHLVGPTAMSWCGFARQIFAESAAAGGPVCAVKAITTADFPTKAERPQNSRLANFL